jgi:hypothetical protein
LSAFALLRTLELRRVEETERSARPSLMERAGQATATLAARQLVVIGVAKCGKDRASDRHNRLRPENNDPVNGIAQFFGDLQNPTELAALAMTFVIFQAVLWPSKCRVPVIGSCGEQRFSGNIQLRCNR